MSEPRQVTLASNSNAEDAAWLAVADVAAVATDLNIDYRLIGGNSVALLVHQASRPRPRPRPRQTVRRAFIPMSDRPLVPVSGHDPELTD